ncbi:amidase domain-containing protein [Siminovitchia fortis]|uniref:amidase domain-containing protein n=1 Tax=Siminovitchia fortis TaxID=254758 RepID=UPI0011A67628|nr:amidase domain-containing protein [Siminovitchia fortis]
MRERLQKMLERKVSEFVGEKKAKDEKVIRKRETMSKRNADIVKTLAVGKISKAETKDGLQHLYYNVHLKHLIKQGDFFYVEEELERRKASFGKKELYEDVEVPVDFTLNTPEKFTFEEDRDQGMERYSYDRMAVVQYAERWWDEYNPAYRKFDVDCTNYVSQCLHAGGAPMRGYPNRSKGWWYRNNNWSFSWAVAHALKNYLQNSTAGLRAREVQEPQELQLGDVICYDFQGDGRFDHNTVVTGKDAYGMPLVNAHTYNSRMRYWAYEDSSAYTPNIQYKMFHIIDGSS